MSAAPPPPTRLVLIRHGESQVTVDRVIGGPRTCSGLSPLGREQALRLRRRLEETGELAGAVLVSSHYARAIETATLIGPAIGDAAAIVEPGFGEHDPGPAIDGLRFDDYVRRFGAPDWGGDPHDEVFPGGETVAEFHDRVGETLAHTLDRHTGAAIAVSCHGGVIDAVFRRLLRTAPTGAFDLWTLNASLTEFVRPEPADDASRWRLVRYNDAGHLAGLPGATARVGDDG